MALFVKHSASKKLLLNMRHMHIQCMISVLGLTKLIIAAFDFAALKILAIYFFP